LREERWEERKEKGTRLPFKKGSVNLTRHGGARSEHQEKIDLGRSHKKGKSCSSGAKGGSQRISHRKNSPWQMHIRDAGGRKNGNCNPRRRLIQEEISKKEKVDYTGGWKKPTTLFLVEDAMKRKRKNLQLPEKENFYYKMTDEGRLNGGILYRRKRGKSRFRGENVARPRQRSQKNHYFKKKEVSTTTRGRGGRSYYFRPPISHQARNGRQFSQKPIRERKKSPQRSQKKNEEPPLLFKRKPTLKWWHGVPSSDNWRGKTERQIAKADAWVKKKKNWHRRGKRRGETDCRV